MKNWKRNNILVYKKKEKSLGGKTKLLNSASKLQ